MWWKRSGSPRSSTRQHEVEPSAAPGPRGRRYCATAANVAGAASSPSAATRNRPVVEVVEQDVPGDQAVPVGRLGRSADGVAARGRGGRRASSAAQPGRRRGGRRRREPAARRADVIACHVPPRVERARRAGRRSTGGRRADRTSSTRSRSAARIPVQVRRGHAALVQLLDPLARALAQLLDRAELDRLRRAGLGAGGDQAVALPVVAEGAFVGVAVEVAARDDAERTGRDAVGAAVADVGLDVDVGDIRCRRSPPSGRRAGRGRSRSACRRRSSSASGRAEAVEQALQRDGLPGRRRGTAR